MTKTEFVAELALAAYLNEFQFRKWARSFDGTAPTWASNGRDVVVSVVFNQVRYVGFRGSDRIRDYLTNVLRLPASTPIGNVHSGFWYSFVALMPLIPGDGRVFAGHSRGGPFAELAGATFGEHHSGVEVWTYGSLAALGKRANAFFDNRVSVGVRYLVRGDPVPLFFTFGYDGAGERRILPRIYNKRTPHAMANYRCAVRRLEHA